MPGVPDDRKVIEDEQSSSKTINQAGLAFALGASTFQVPQKDRLTKSDFSTGSASYARRILVGCTYLAPRFSSIVTVVSLVVIVLLFPLLASPLRAGLDFLRQELFDLASLIGKKSPADPEVERKANAALQQSEKEGDEFTYGIASIQLHRNATFNANHRQGYEGSQQIMLLSPAVLEAGFRTWGHTFAAESLFLLGNPTSGYEQAKQAILHYNPSQQIGLVRVIGADAKTTSLGYAAFTQWVLGYPDQALRTGTEAVAWAQQINHPYSIAFARNMRACIYQLRGDSKRSLSDASEAIRFSSIDNQRFPFYLAMGTVVQGRAMVEDEGAAIGIRRIQEGLRLRPPKGLVAQTYFRAMLAEAYGKAGMLEQGITELKTAQENVEATQERFFEAEINRIHGELLRQANAPDREAERHFLKALAIARTQSAKSLELRAAVSLARLWQKQGKVEEARNVLAKIYDGFSEGLETKDLQEARAFLTPYP